MGDDDILILKGDEIFSLLEGRELDLIGAVRQAYEAHAKGSSLLPHSTFLRFPDDQANRIIALPAYLGDGFDVAGIKWIASFPGNLLKGVERASAVVILNRTETGRPFAILEGSIISSKRTAASASLAAQTLQNGREPSTVGVIGCGLINFETVRFLLAASRGITTLVLYDSDADRAQIFKDKCGIFSNQVEVRIAKDVNSVLDRAQLVSLATTAAQPHISDISNCAQGCTILHTSLRDFSPEVILSCDNVVDDIDHVCRAQTSIHLAEQLTGGRDFIRCTLADILTGSAPAKSKSDCVTIFSPFGLGLLDLAVSQLAVELALEQKRGRIISSFLPEPWTQRM